MEILIIGILAIASFVHHCETTDALMDRPPSIIVNARYPDVYEALIKALRTFSYEDYHWNISYPDPDKGYIQAKCRFREDVTKHLRGQKRAIDLNIYLAERDSGVTEVSYSFDVLSEYGRVEAARVIRATESCIRVELKDAEFHSKV